MTEFKIGDRIRFTPDAIEGTVSYAARAFEGPEAGDYVELDGDSLGFYTNQGTVEILEKLLTVGDEVNTANKHLLPEKYIVADKSGEPWTQEHLPYAGNIDSFGFRLVYIHDSNANNEENNV